MPVSIFQCCWANTKFCPYRKPIGQCQGWLGFFFWRWASLWMLSIGKNFILGAYSIQFNSIILEIEMKIHAHFYYENICREREREKAKQNMNIPSWTTRWTRSWGSLSCQTRARPFVRICQSKKKKWKNKIKCKTKKKLFPHPTNQPTKQPAIINDGQTKLKLRCFDAGRKPARVRSFVFEFDNNNWIQFSFNQNWLDSIKFSFLGCKL